MSSPATKPDSAPVASPRILIVGGSTRAAADSVRRSGWQPVCADLFADLDLRRTAEIVPVHKYPDSLPEDVAQVHADGWFYCGALENRPDLIERMLAMSDRIGPLLGTPPDALRIVRDPERLMHILRSEGMPALEIANQSKPPACDGSWLQKPLASAGGRAIRVWDSTAAKTSISEPHYFQRQVYGSRLSAVFVFEGQTAELFGMSRELSADTISTPPSSFSYCGTCGPLESLSDSNPPTALPHSIQTIRPQLAMMSNVLLKHVPSLRGPIGLDFVFDGQTAWLTEVNPRYTASIEILELSSGRSILNPNVHRTGGSWPHRILGKRVLYAESRIITPELDWLRQDDDPWNRTPIADIPIPGSIVEPGWPICTIFAASSEADTTESEFLTRAIEVRTAISAANRVTDNVIK